MGLGAIDRWLPQGSLLRYGAAGAFNTAVFGVVLVVLSMVTGIERDDALRWATVWGVAWTLSSLVAHATHRLFTFNATTGLAWSLSSSIPVFALGMVGSSTTFGVLVDHSTSPLAVLTVVNVGAWGVVLWALNRTVVFAHGPPDGSLQDE